MFRFLPHVKMFVLYLTSPEAETLNTSSLHHWMTK
jgi:hypothetical protein